MDFKQLEYFHTIYEEGSISKAAEKLYISQQGLSKAILSLEKELDCQLFERNARGVLLTDAGEVFLVHTLELLHYRNNAMKDMRRYREHESLSIDMVIGSRFSFPQGFFKEFLKNHSDMDIRINELKNETCIYNVQHGKADLAVVVGKERTKGYVYELLKQDSFTLVMPKTHELAEREEVLLSELNQQVIVYCGGSSSFTFVNLCKEMGIHFEKVIEVPGMLALYQTCENLGVIGVSLSSIESKMAFSDLVSVPIGQEEAAWDIVLMYHETALKQKPVKEFVDYVRDRLR